MIKRQREWLRDRENGQDIKRMVMGQREWL